MTESSVQPPLFALEKRCAACGVVKPLDAFHRLASSPDRRHNRCAECRRAENSRDYYRHREQRQETSRAWKAANPERVREREQSRDKTALRVTAARYRVEHPEERRAAARLYYQRHPERVRRHVERRRARLRRAPINDLTASQWQETKVRFGGRCAYCGRDDLPLTKDHVVPLSRGGSHTAANVVPACQPCNSRKYNKLVAPQDYDAIIEELRA